MHYIKMYSKIEQARVTYRSKYSKEEKEFSALEWMAVLCSHIPNQGEQMVRYYGHYSNVCSGRLKKEKESSPDCYIILEGEYPKKSNRSWARLIKKIYEVDPLVCPKCGGEMRIIAFIEDYKVIKKILDYLGILFKRDRPPPRALAVADSFDDYKCDDYINTDYMDF